VSRSRDDATRRNAEREAKERHELEVLRKEIREKELELREKFGELRGRILATREGLRSDLDLREALRLKAWAKANPNALRDHIRYDSKVGELVIDGSQVSGWPKGVDPTQFIGAIVKKTEGELLARLDGLAEGGPVASGGAEEPSPSVQALRSIVGGGHE
jgi:hypothetical protein